MDFKRIINSYPRKIYSVPGIGGVIRNNTKLIRLRKPTAQENSEVVLNTTNPDPEFNAPVAFENSSSVEKAEHDFSLVNKSEQNQPNQSSQSNQTNNNLPSKLESLVPKKREHPEEQGSVKPKVLQKKRKKNIEAQKTSAGRKQQRSHTFNFI